jgi:hypothetical protein
MGTRRTRSQKKDDQAKEFEELKKGGDTLKPRGTLSGKSFYRGPIYGPGKRAVAATGIVGMRNRRRKRDKDKVVQMITGMALEAFDG